mgnify:CR=1 FL=1
MIRSLAGVGGVPVAQGSEVQAPTRSAAGHRHRHRIGNRRLDKPMPRRRTRVRRREPRAASPAGAFTRGHARARPRGPRARRSRGSCAEFCLLSGRARDTSRLYYSSLGEPVLRATADRASTQPDFERHYEASAALFVEPRPCTLTREVRKPSLQIRNA